MARKKSEKPTKDKVFTMRLSQDMDKLFSMVAHEQGVTIGKFLRDSGLILAEMSTDQKQIVDLIKDKDVLDVQKTFHILFQETKDIVVNSSQSMFEGLTERMDRLEKLLELFMYVYLYHTPEIVESKKESSKKSAQIRKKKIMSILSRNDKKA